MRCNSIGGMLMAAVLSIGGLGCDMSSGTYHTRIVIPRPAMGAMEGTTPRVDFDAVVRIVDAWAVASGMGRVPADHPARRLSWGTSNANGNEQVLHYLEREPEKKAWPIELILAYDPDAVLRDVHISMGSRFSKEPTKRFRSMHESLVAAMKNEFGDDLDASIW